MQKEKGLFITFEGADGVGKTTQSKQLFSYLEKEGYATLATREPGGTVTGEKIREILLDPECEMGKRTEALLYLAVRAEHVDKIVKPALTAGKIVVSDRFSDSTFVYQGIARGIAREAISPLNAFAADGLLPGTTFLLDAPVELMQQRMNERSEVDRIEKEGIIFQKRVREGFLQLAEKYPQRIVVIDALLSVEDIQAIILKHIDKQIKEKNIKKLIPVKGE